MDNNSKGFCMYYDWMEDFVWLDDDGFKQILYGIYQYHVDEDFDPSEAVSEKYIPLMSLIYHQLERQREQNERNAKRTEKMNSKNKSGDTAAGTGDSACEA